MAVGSAHLARLTRCPHSSPSCCWTPTPSVERTRRSTRGHWWSSRRPPRVSPPPHHLPFIPTTHPTTMQGQPHLPCQHRMGVYTTTPFTHPHHHASHLSHSPRWRCHRSVGTTPHYLADQRWPLPPQTHAGHIPHHALSRPPLQAQGGREAANRQCEPGVSTQVRVNRSGPRVVRAVGRRRARSLLGILRGYTAVVTWIPCSAGDPPCFSLRAPSNSQRGNPLTKPLTLPRCKLAGELRSRDMHLLVLEVKNVSRYFSLGEATFSVYK